MGWEGIGSQRYGLRGCEKQIVTGSPNCQIEDAKQRNHPQIRDFRHGKTFLETPRVSNRVENEFIGHPSFGLKFQKFAVIEGCLFIVRSFT